jgi:Ca-activated chloride channel family protein
VQRVLVVMSDGEAFDDAWKPLVAQLKQRGVRLVTLGVGTSAGALIPLGRDGVVRDATGAEVVSKLKAATLEEMAKATGGLYAPAPSWVNVVDLLKRVGTAEPKATAFVKDQTRLVERYVWALLPALVLLALSYWRELPVRPRARDVRLPVAKPVAARPRAAFVAGLATLSLLSLILVGYAQDAAENEDPNSPAARTPMATLGAMVGRRIEQILSKPKPESFDCVSLTIDLIAYMENNLKARQRFPVSVPDDALRAVALGEALERVGGDWPKLRAEIDALARANREPWQTARPDAAGKTALTPSFDPAHDMIESNGRGGVGFNPSDSNAASGEPDETKAKFAANSAFGSLAANSAAPDPGSPPPPSDMQVVGNERTAADQERDEYPELILPLQKLDHVRSQDAPAKLFQMLEGTRHDLVSQGPDW